MSGGGGGGGGGWGGCADPLAPPGYVPGTPSKALDVKIMIIKFSIFFYGLKFNNVRSFLEL